ncbi:hypothetical protein ACQ4M4_24340 [Leptolyngbya sp. AN02str]|uniref:hypothetical protein n=1 Tax=Leptolyngbya sp. AN02str TaxID=3423363 RepID=UPI003D31C2E0
MGIAPFIRFGIGEEQEGICRQSSVLGETFEALVAAVHIDAASYEKTKRVVIDLFCKPALESPKTQTSHPGLPFNVSNPLLRSPETQTPHPGWPFNDSEEIWVLGGMCDTCFQPDLCTTNGMCYFELTGDD